MENKTSWSYSGDNGPENWGEICLCGKSQSPIDITECKETDTPSVIFRYTISEIEVLNTGHTIQVNLMDRFNSIVIEDTVYILTQFHFHSPSEHTIDKSAFAMELHLVHMNEEGNIAVVGIMINCGAENAIVSPFWNDMIAAKTIEERIDVEKLIPTVSGFYCYNGSLTTPPCTEGVTWLLFDTPIEFSQSQIEAFTSVFPPNNRPLQPRNGRDIIHLTIVK